MGDVVEVTDYRMSFFNNIPTMSHNNKGRMKAVAAVKLCSGRTAAGSQNVTALQLHREDEDYNIWGSNRRRYRMVRDATQTQQLTWKLDLLSTVSDRGYIIITQTGMKKVSGCVLMPAWIHHR